MVHFRIKKIILIQYYNMSEQIISPSVLIREVDLSSLPSVIQQIDAVFISPAEKGRYFVPETVNSVREFDQKFGRNTTTNYLGFAVRNYIREGGTPTILSVGNIENYGVPAYADILVSDEENLDPNNFDTDAKTVARIFMSKKGVEEGYTTITVTGKDDDFDLVFSDGNSNTETVANLSLHRGDNNFIGTFKNPLSSNTPFFVQYLVDIDDQESEAGLDMPIDKGDFFTYISVITQGSGDNDEILMSAYREATSPWVLSQPVAGSNRRLFRFHTLQDGDLANRSYKIEINNIRTADEVNPRDPQWGEFTVVVRRYNDRDNDQSILETFTNVNLNPDSPRFIARVIGDLNTIYDNSTNSLIEEGLYDNNSNHIRIEMGDVEDFDEKFIPVGFENYNLGANFFSGAPMPFFKYPVEGRELESGIDFDKRYIDYLHKRLPLSQADGLEIREGVASEFFLLYGEETLDSNTEFTEFFSDTFEVADRRMVFGFFGGSDGMDETIKKAIGEDMSETNTFGFDMSSTESNGFKSYQRALNILDDTDRYDMNELVLTGINLEQHEAIANEAIGLVEKRADVYLILDATSINATEGDAVTSARGFDTSFAGAYYPWLYTSDAGKTVPVPLSTIVPSIFAFNDRVARPWFAPLAFQRGQVTGALRPVRWVKKTQRDALVTNNVNPVSNVNGELLLLGNETLQLRNTVLSKVNIRRLLNRAKKFISGVAWRFIGLPNNAQTRGDLQAIINEYLGEIQAENGLDRFLVNFGSELNEGDAQRRDVIRGVIILQPTLATEGVDISIQLTDDGVIFDD